MCTIPILTTSYPQQNLPVLGANNVSPDPIGEKYNFIVIPKMRWTQLYIMDTRRHFQKVFKCGIGDWNILRLVEGDCFGALEPFYTIVGIVHVVYLG